MKRMSPSLAVLLSFLASATAAQPARELRGKVFHLGENGEEVVEAGIIVTLQENGASDDANDQGIFRLSLLLSSGGTFKAHDPVTLSSDKPGWRIRYPLDGELRIPPNLDREIVKVELLPAGSKLFWTHDRLEKFIRDLSEKVKQAEAREAQAPKTRSAKGLPRPRPGTRTSPRGSLPLSLPPAFQPGESIGFARLLRTSGRIERSMRDLSETARQETGSAREASTPPLASGFDRHIQEWAAQYGFSAEEAKVEIGRWITEVKTHQEDAHRLGLAAFAEGRFAEASRHFRHSARERTRQLDETRHRREGPAEQGRLREELVRDLRLEGDSFLNGGNPLKALASYQEAHRYTSREETPELWAATLHDNGFAHGRLGNEGPPAARAAHVTKAIQAYRRTLLVYTREKLPQQWAMTQNNLGVALREQALRTDGERSHELLAEAVEACRQALLVYVRDRFPLEWATTQSNLAIALRAQAVRIEGQRGAELLAEAVAAYRQALLVRTHEELPEDWARTQNNLGVALREQASRAGGEPGAQLLAEAVQAFRQALLVRTHDRFPQQWATTQNNLGNALQDQALRTDGEAGAQLLAEAVRAYRQALLVQTHEQRAMTQNNLGNALQEQALRTEGEAGARLLAEAVEIFREALLVRTRDELPQQWALTQNNLGNALRDQGTRTAGDRGTQLLAEAIRAYRQALRVRTREQFPQDWAMTQINLGAALVEHAARAQGERRARSFAEALQAYRQALEVFSYESFPGYRIMARRGETQVLLLTGNYREAAEVLSEILTRNPDDSKAFSSLVLLLSNNLFDPVRALTVIQKWLTTHPEDLAARMLETEALFASGAFADCREKAASLRKRDEIPSPREAVLLGYQLAAGLAAGSAEPATDLALLLEVVAKQSPDFSTGWTFPGSLHSLQERSGLPHRDWLVRFFQALEAPNRDSILQQLRALQKELGINSR
jgi:tetratricopeptide (TPR) repeat protein